MKIRRVRTEDVNELMRLEEGSIEHPWTSEDLMKLATEQNKAGFAAEEDGKIIGYIGLSFILDEAEIGNLVVDKDFRRQGIGGSLIEQVKDFLKDQGIAKVFLEVAEDNESAKALYLKSGFNSFNIRKDYYGKGRNALLMLCEF
ncbi:MAG: ribosomal protein S18-alanine N-acetyltransferase [Saccharofermentans sp.]|nr:ribosomal protein S18-alanine N-acetyltransferase [Saccharofermentans sp.]